ncbi:two component transcriptional regulator, LytTR family [Tenacibaculum mesophilum]|uniref:DNA-binding response regulator n=1 Tax=Tenacibaculum mesophilum TaxID=104268 RepID=A0AAE9SJQ8_9FLAO|nr:LytTR family DNA-binding domain-containing protein [Tenacibaculum mesophilum]GFD83264.1 DNA-binding response regulator [Tenacibaculum sp. KUL118]AZJ31251.1 DNA-binding response regulator [Tenacibaculum mesophilum]QFS29298.1 response regulator [Tenacibaculum mesophilum]UTD16726.1 response regulator transcription factor [Tenacibaculum mesophilum]SHF49201.1 two component transcriptional regulator, LytTR family [Tenacibaculum mesophilum]
MKKLSAILVDDMSTALEMLQNDLIKFHPEIEIIGTAKSVVEASKVLRKQQPDILFLDIMLGDGTGFDVLEIHPNLSSKIIFVTASDEYAIKAFKFAAIDYVLKPYSNEDLASAINKAKNQIKPDKEQLTVLQQSISKPNQRPKKISLNTSDKIMVVNLDDIVRCQSDNNYTEFFMNDGQKILVGKTLKHFADMLKEYDFLRVHQSHLINIQFIKEFIKSDGGYLVLKNKTTVPVSVRKKNEVINVLERM